MRTILLCTAMLIAAPAQAQEKGTGTGPVATATGKSVGAVAGATERARIQPRAAGWQGATQRFVYAPGGLYQVTAAVGRVTAIMLQEGESLSDTGAVAAGDTVRWVIGEAASGSGATRRTQILVKPTDPGLVTNLVINTDRRSYTVELRSTASTYMASVAWSYPQDELIALQARSERAAQIAATQIASGLDPARLDFGYRIKGDKPAWRPSQVFDDGAKTYILFPDSIGQSEMPPLFLIGEKKQAELVNYRLSGRYMVIDRLFDVAELRLGTKKQQIVRIERTAARNRRS
jgi:type IV secretion system protein VirB9